MHADATTSAEEAAAQRWGIALALLVTLLFAGLNVMSKHVSLVYPMVQILWFRYLLLSCFGVGLATHKHGRAAFRSLVPLLQVARALILVTEAGVYVFAFRNLPLADISAISGTGPLVVTAMSALLLREAVGVRRWTAVCVGFVGVLIIVRPGFGAFNAWHLVPLGGMVLWATYQVLTRLVSRYDSSERSTLFTGTVGFGAVCLLLPFFWQPVDLEWTLKLLLLGVFGVAGHSTLIKALSLAPASLLQPFSYVGLVWAVLFGWLFFGDIPVPATLVGALVIVASGLYTLHRQRVRSAQGT